MCTRGFSGGSDSKESACNAGGLGSIPGLGRFHGGGHGNPPQYSFLQNLHGQRSLEGHSPRGHKESDTTERLRTAIRTIKMQWSLALYVPKSLCNLKILLCIKQRKAKELLDESGR